MDSVQPVAEAIAVITDIHANLPALHAALARIDELGLERVCCGGDLVGYGPPSQRGLRAHRGAADPDDLRQLRLRDRARPRRLRLCLTTASSASSPSSGRW